MGFGQYYRDLFRQFERMCFYWRHRPFICSDVQINSLVEQFASPEYCSERHEWLREIKRLHKHDRFVRESYKVYKENATFEEQVLKGSEFFTDLCTGLLQLNRLKCISFSTVQWKLREGTPWPVDYFTLYGDGKGSPLVRTWNPFHLAPKRSCDSASVLWKSYDHFKRLTRALAETNRCVTTFSNGVLELGGGLPSYALARPVLSDIQVNQAVAAFSKLEKFEFSITRMNPDDPDDLEDLGVLPKLLWHMKHLKTLSLRLNDERYYRKPPGPWYRYSQVFPERMMWLHLTNLSLCGLATSALDLIFLFAGAPHLKFLTLAHIELLEGAWEGVTTFLQLSKHLQGLSLLSGLTHHGGVPFAPRETRGTSRLDTLRRAIEAYVVSGGRHPCLTPDSHPHTLLWWYCDLFPEEMMRDAKLIARQFGVNLELPHR